MSENSKPGILGKVASKVKVEGDVEVIYGSDPEQDMLLALQELKFGVRSVDGKPLEPPIHINDQPRIFINGFPKAGTHMLSLYMLGLARPSTNPPWLSSWTPSPWSVYWSDLWLFADMLNSIPPGTSIRGHVGYHPRIRLIFERMHYNHVFIYRNLRDVAVSAAHHVMTPMDHSNIHPGKDFYHSLDSFEDVLCAIIEGTPQYPGVIDRWRYYLPWLVDDRTLAISYEYCLQKPGYACRDMLAYHYQNAASWHGLVLDFDQEALLKAGRALARHAQATHMSSTYRQGKVGGWRDEWSDKVERVFRRAGGHRWDAPDMQPWG